MDLRELLEDLHHAVVVLERVHASPGQVVVSRDQVFVEGLMHVPQEAEMNTGHREKPSIAQITPRRSLLCRAARVSKRFPVADDTIVFICGPNKTSSSPAAEALSRGSQSREWH